MSGVPAPIMHSRVAIADLCQPRGRRAISFQRLVLFLTPAILVVAVLERMPAAAPVASRPAPVVLLSLAFLVCVGVSMLLTSPAWRMNSLTNDRAKSVVSIRTPADVASWLFDWDWNSFVTDRPPDENHFADAEQRPGVGPYNCSAEDIELQATTWRRMISESRTRWQIHCAGSNVTRALHRSSPGRLGKIFVDIGANKG